MKIRSRGARPAHRRVTVARAAPVGGALLLGAALGACSFTSPQTIATPYAASDGVNGSIPDPATGTSVLLRNMLLVTTGEGAPGLLVGAVANQGTEPVNVTLTVLDPQGNPVGGGTVRAPAQGLTELGSGGVTITVASVPSIPGSNLQLQVDTPSGGDRLTLPVLPNQGPYVDETPPASSPSPTSSPSASPSPTS